MKDINAKKAVIYCRVSSTQQTIRTDGLSSQEQRCRSYCEHKGYDVVSVFKDDMSGSLVKRPGMDAMIEFLQTTRKHSHVVIIDDISRLARGVDAHLQLRADLGGAGALLESPSIEFGEDPDSILVENLLACVSQHARQKNAEQTLNRMTARVQQGFWVFQAVWGYKYARCASGGKILVHHEPLASILREALEGFASGRFASQAEVMRFLEMQPSVPKMANGTVSNERVKQILTNPIYAGIVHVPSWNVTPRVGKHAPLISIETFNTIQERLKGKARGAVRADVSADFPLRGHVCCPSCGHPLTANYSKGRQGAAYPYYLCRQRSCDLRGKSYAREKVEGAFEALLRSVIPAKELVELATATFRDLWNKQALNATQSRKAIEKEIAETDRKVKQLLDRIVEAESQTLISAYETRIADLESSKLLLKENLARSGQPRKNFDESFRNALAFLASPWNLWDNGSLAEKKMALRLTFPKHLIYDPKGIVRNSELSLPFKMLFDLNSSKMEMARPAGFEPATPSLEGTCSIQLSYGRQRYADRFI
jgi:site-specific DNA recombinase